MILKCINKTMFKIYNNQLINLCKNNNYKLLKYNKLKRLSIKFLLMNNKYIIHKINFNLNCSININNKFK